MQTSAEVLCRGFGLEAFRGRQTDVIDAALSGKDVVVLMCFVLPGC